MIMLVVPHPGFLCGEGNRFAQFGSLFCPEQQFLQFVVEDHAPDLNSPFVRGVLEREQVVGQRFEVD